MSGQEPSVSTNELKKRIEDFLSDTKDASKTASQLYVLLASEPELSETPLPIFKGKHLILLLRMLKTADLSSAPGRNLYQVCQSSLAHLQADTPYIYRTMLHLMLGRKLNEPLLQLVLSDQTVLQQFICQAVATVDASSANHTINLLSYILNNAQQCLDTEIVDYISQSLHNCIINTECVNDKLLRTTLQLYVKLGTLAYERGDLVTSSNIDKILQFQVFLDHFSVKEYAAYFQGKDATWTENSLLSLETLAYPKLADISYTTPASNIQWKSVIDYLDLFVLVSSYSNGDNIKNTLLRPVLSFLLKLCRIVDIPIEHGHNFKICVSKILHFAYVNDLRPYENVKFFLILLSYISFSADTEVRENAFIALTALLSLEKDIVAPYIGLDDSENFNDLCLECLTEYNNEITHMYIVKLLFEKTNSRFFAFNFDELFYTIQSFANIDVIRAYNNAFTKYPEKLKKICLDQLHKSNFFSTLDTHSLNLIKLVIDLKKSIKKLDSFRLQVVPLYPGATRRETRIYLYVLLSLTAKKKLDMNDFMICDMFRYNDPDIQSCLTAIFNKFSVIDPLLNKLIDKISDQNTVLVSVVESSDTLYKDISVSDNRFRIIKACVIGNSKHFLFFLRFFANMIESTPAGFEKRPLYNLLKTVEKTYLDWEINDRILFWEELSSFSADASLSESFLKILNEFIESLKADDRHIIVNQKMNIPLVINDFENKTTEELKQIIIDKVTFHKQTTKAHLKSKKILNINKAKKSTGEEIVKILNLPLDKSDEEIKVSITVYPNGRYTGETADKSEGKKTKKLNQRDRKFLFLRNLSADKSSKIVVQGKPTVITKYSSHFIKIMTNDLFKGIFQGKSNIGKFAAHLFNSKLNFISASDEEIQQALKKFRLNCDEFTKYLFVKLVFYLDSRSLMDANLRTKLKSLNSEGGSLSEFLKEEFTYSQKS
ncbi:hypothetical protein PICMEDRAFT_131288 [Pichia membranifaciens NRRL Y-2026]|uniref:Uncharacterized protein n=1 Tax=Pichia membranifaciens NRRL Y-2026 TaxID=763406 RepID=A0A1E3NKB2_9ASCO|nr:hypothetical protein PICMEDRAFT_131288 [Pichia membranifaciens NRRL Y-2026]ODQ46526.1 hypothetical protein PICMEDRAFT_131288 [Pichia membranifaciens NRRL Y-2026]